jgi:hypothetical protein
MLFLYFKENKKYKNISPSYSHTKPNVLVIFEYSYIPRTRICFLQARVLLNYHHTLDQKFHWYQEDAWYIWLLSLNSKPGCFGVA